VAKRVRRDGLRQSRRGDGPGELPPTEETSAAAPYTGSISSASASTSPGVKISLSITVGAGFGPVLAGLALNCPQSTAARQTMLKAQYDAKRAGRFRVSAP
jgi:hypothetical protein